MPCQETTKGALDVAGGNCLKSPLFLPLSLSPSLPPSLPPSSSLYLLLSSVSLSSSLNQCRLSRSIAQRKRARLITWRSWDRNPVERWSFLSSDVYRAAHSQVYWGWLPQFFSQKDYLPVRFRELDASNSILVAGSVEGAPLSWDIGAAW